MSGRSDFRPGGQWSLAAITLMVCLVSGLFMGRPDVVVLGFPLVFAASSGWDRLRRSARRRGGSSTGSEPVEFRIEADRDAAADGHRTFRVTSSGSDDISLIQASVPGRPLVSALTPVGGTFAVSVPVPRSGRARVLTVGAAVVTVDGVMHQRARELDPVLLTVLPAITETRLLPLPQRLRGHTGEHVSRSTGDGGELRGIDAFRPGDQPRRIDWRATARQSTDQDRLFVRRSYAHSEAGVHLLVDTAYDYPASLQAWFSPGTEPVGGTGSLHLAREAATLLAASYLAVGDRVGMNDLSGRHWPLRASSGRRQLELIRTHVALMAASPRPERPPRDAGAPAGSMIYLISPFTDEEPARLIRLWQAAGHRVIGVDTFPVLKGRAASPSARRAVRLILLRRRQVLNTLAAAGMPVLGYRGDVPSGHADTLDSMPGQLPLSVGLASLRRPSRHGGTTAGEPS